MPTTEARDKWQRFQEPVHRTLIRNVAIAVGVGAGVALIRRNAMVFLPTATLALWPSLGGHFVELAFLNFIRSRAPASRPSQIAVRVFTWFAGGCLLYVCMVGTARALSLAPLPIAFVPYAGLIFIGVELIAHAVMAARGRPSFYDGRA
jgi:hypothetical protein